MLAALGQEKAAGQWALDEENDSYKAATRLTRHLLSPIQLKSGHRPAAGEHSNGAHLRPHQRWPMMAK